MSKVADDDASEPGGLVHAGLDRIDAGIVSQLQEDGRRSYRDIARNLDLSESLVRWRTLRLFRKGTVRILAVTDPFELGYQVLAMIALTVEPRALKEVTEFLIETPEVLYVTSCGGRANLLIEVVCKDHEGLVYLLTDTLGSIEGVRAAETFIELKIHKFSYTSPQWRARDKVEVKQAKATAPAGGPRKKARAGGKST
jgi:Lrp/AsnC family transcriptional regulator, regulator for asnA, asnC and gidA